jgi:cytidylate kinase
VTGIEYQNKKIGSGSILSNPKPSGRGVKGLTIAIDGPSGAGKSTVAKSLAKRLGYLYVDTGAMYRAVALRAKEKSIRPGDELALSRLASSLHISFVTEGEKTFILCDGEDITESIRSPEISRLASEISKKRSVRDALVEKQREMGREGGVVLEGRDIGTVVFPNAEVKFYLDAQAEERGRRRFKELIGKGVEVDFKETLEEVMQRDHNDMHRGHSPLKKAEDAVLIDSTHRSVEEVVEEMVRLVFLAKER